MCRERTSPTLRQNVSFHLCLQESYVLTVAHSNKNVFLFYSTKGQGFCEDYGGFCVEDPNMCYNMGMQPCQDYYCSGENGGYYCCCQNWYESTSVITNLVRK